VFSALWSDYRAGQIACREPERRGSGVHPNLMNSGWRRRKSLAADLPACARSNVRRAWEIVRAHWHDFAPLARLFPYVLRSRQARRLVFPRSKTVWARRLFEAGNSLAAPDQGFKSPILRKCVRRLCLWLGRVEKCGRYSRAYCDRDRNGRLSCFLVVLAGFSMTF